MTRGESASSLGSFVAHPVFAYFHGSWGICPQSPGISYEIGASKDKVGISKYVVVA
jgi:hypothetical protein